jgi:AAHS family 4-hydroxybenzoate transporter-like MFS transporter
MAAIAGADAGAEVVKIETFGPYQKLILLVGIIVLFADGFDAQIISVLAPILSKEWGVPRTAFAEVFSANIFGLMTGAILVTPLADVLSRKFVTMACVGLFGVLSLLTTTMASVEELAIIRFFSGLALGGAMPSMIAATSDFLPGKLRTRLVVLLSTAWSFGIAVCAFTTANIVGAGGWKAMFYTSGAIAIVSLVLLGLFVPQSPAYLVRKGQLEKLKAVLHKLDPKLEYIPGEAAADVQKKKSPVTALFAGNLALITPLVWVTYLAAGVTVYFFINWLPTFVTTIGYGAAEAPKAASAYQLGGLLGGFLISQFVDRKGVIAIACSMILAGIVVAIVGYMTASFAMLAFGAALCGFLVVGSQNTVNAFVGGHLYPAHIRATGLGIALACIRLSGAIAGAFGVKALLELDLGPQTTFAVIGAPEAFAGLCLLAIHLITKNSIAKEAAGTASAKA